MPEIITLIAVFLVGSMAGFMGSIAGGGGLISIPFLIFIGLPPQVAIATDRLGSIGQAITACYKFWKAKKIIWKHVVVLTALALAGALIGANILLSFNQENLRNVVGLALVILLPLIFLKRNIGFKKVETTKTKMLIGLAIYFLVQVFTGFFGGGTGPIIFYTLMYFFGFSIIESNATNNIPWIVLSVTSLIIFALNGLVDYKNGIVLLFGMAIGGYLGAHTALKKGDSWVKGIFAIIVIISGIKLLFF